MGRHPGQRGQLAPGSLREAALVLTICGHTTCTRVCEGRGQAHTGSEKGSDLPRATQQGGQNGKRTQDPKGRLPNGPENSRDRRERVTSAIGLSSVLRWREELGDWAGKLGVELRQGLMCPGLDSREGL